ncbi:MAG: RNA polymerase sigma-70 factor [Bacteroidetes bacterium]|nr:RNA polymerase sigma-70 factor [Bacteroidota bacterium]
MPGEHTYNENTPDEKALLLQMARGDAAAFSEIYELYRDRVFAFVFALTKSRELSADAVQEVFVRLWEKREQLDIGKTFGAYVKTITYHFVIDFFRKARRDRALQQKLLLNMEALRVSGEDEVLGRELHTLYRTAIGQLPEQRRKLYLLSRDQQLSYEEIAAQTGLSKNTVRNQIAAAIRFIRQYVANHSDMTCLLLAICLHKTKG